MILGSIVLPDGRRVVVAGLSDENLTRLRAGQPIHKSLRPVAEVELMICHGATEDAIRDELARELPSATFVDLRP